MADRNATLPTFTKRPAKSWWTASVATRISSLSALGICAALRPASLGCQFGPCP